MSFTTFALGWLAVAVVSALLAALLAGRWGRDPFGWLLAGAVLGPFAFVALVALHLDDRRAPHPARASRTQVPLYGRMNILLAADGSEPSTRAAEWIVRSFSGAPVEVTVCTVLPRERAEAASPPADTAPAMGVDAEAQEAVQGACETLERSGFSCRTVIRFGDPGEEIVALADEENVELIVLGRRGREGVAKLLLGSVSEKVVKNSSRPVMVVS
jgi:nucleotide-binding universal stress UspA family protein